MKNKVRKILMIFSCLIGLSFTLSAQNPYLPLWEFIPDGEPYVFEDPDCPGKYRLYIYGSHDNLKWMYCGRDQVVWSAPVEDLTRWRYDGVIFKVNELPELYKLNADGTDDVLFAPDVTVTTDADGKKTYYLFPNNQGGGRNSMIAKSDRPDGPFTVCNWHKERPRETFGCLGFDPAVFVDDDGRVYGYWGFGISHGAELDPATMCTVKPGTEVVENMISGYRQEGIFRFFETSSIRKIEDKYVFIYSRTTAEGEDGLPNASNYTLAYAYSEHPLGPWTYGGTIIDARAREYDEKGNVIASAMPGGNTHGSICKIGGQWYVFYHRQIGTDCYARQAMVSAIDVKVEKGKGGKVVISRGEFNSEGFLLEGLNPMQRISAGLACWHTNPGGIKEVYPHYVYTGSYIRPVYRDNNPYAGDNNHKIPFAPVVNNTSGSIVGYKYLNMNAVPRDKSLQMQLRLKAEDTDGRIRIMLGSPWTTKGGVEIGLVDVKAGSTCREFYAPLSIPAKLHKGKQPLFFVFESETEGQSICEFYDFLMLARP